MHSVKRLQRFAAITTDGHIARLRTTYVDDRRWIIRHLVVRPAQRLSARDVLVAPACVSRIESTRRRLRIALSSRQLARNPGAWTDRPVSRQQQTGIDDIYWYALFPGRFALRWGASGVIRPRRHDDHHLRSSRELVGYYVHARDDEIGHITDFLMDERSWAIRYAVVDTRNWWPGKIVLVPVEYILWVSWGAATIYVDLLRSTIGNAPPYNDRDRALTGRGETRLLEYYDHSRRQHTPVQASRDWAEL